MKGVRLKREDFKSLIANYIDPNEQKKQKKKENTFYKVSQEWHEN